MQDRHFSDEELVAYLDGEAELALVDQIHAALQSDPVLNRRLDALRLDLDALRDSFDLLEPSPQVIDAPFAAEARMRPPPRGTWRPLATSALAASVALVVGFGLGQRSSDQKGWIDYVAAYQALYTTATLDHIAQSPDQLDAELTRVSAVIGKEIALDHLTGIRDAEYKRGQVLSFEGRPLVQLAFATPDGVPIALCIIRSSGGTTGAQPMAEMQLEGLSAASWSDGGHDYLLIGGSDDDLVRRMSQALLAVQI